MGCANTKLAAEPATVEITGSPTTTSYASANNNKASVPGGSRQNQPLSPPQQVRQSTSTKNATTPTPVNNTDPAQAKKPLGAASKAVGPIHEVSTGSDNGAKQPVQAQRHTDPETLPSPTSQIQPNPPPPSSTVARRQSSSPPRQSSNSRLGVNIGRIARGKKGRNGSNNGLNGTNNNNNNSEGGKAPLTRTRVDSWATETTTTTSGRNAGATHNNTVEQQWKYLWKTQSPHLLDPADVPSCLGMMRSHITNRLSSTEVTFIQRRIRTLLRQMAVSAPSNKMGRVFSGASGAKVEADAKNLAQQQHLLSLYVISKLWKGVPRNISDGSPAEDGAVTVNVLENAYILMLYMSESLWPLRIAEVARQTAATAKMDMDVNHLTKHKDPWAMPKPSIVPDLADAPSVPAGVQLQDVCFLTALGRRSPRQQRLQLLFYLCMPQLKEFLDAHPAGGVPTWLLEVGQGQVVSLASLTHYHYYGTAFLPHESSTTSEKVSSFVPSQSRQPVMVSSNVVRNLVARLLSNLEDGGEEEGITSPTHSPTRRSSYKLVKRISSHDQISTLNNNSGHGNMNGGDDNGAKQPLATDETVFAPSDAMACLQELTNDYDDPELIHAAAKLEVDRSSAPNQNGATMWTLEDFKGWADKELDDLMLDACFHRLFGMGVLPSFSTERDLVQSKWNEWYNAWHEKLEAHGGLNGVHSKPNNDPIGGMVSSFGGLGGLDGCGGTGYGILHCVDKQWWNRWVAYTGFGGARRRTLQRPGDISTERLLEKDSEGHIPGSFGSYEPMKHNLVRNQDYVLVPPNVWDVLFEMYGGGPPLPRMILPPNNKKDKRSGNGQSDEGRGDARFKLMSHLSVACRPWVIHCTLCDPSQPYRRGDVGAFNIRIMALPHQPLWRLFGEIAVRMPLQAYKAYEANGRGMARLWKKIEPSTGGKEPAQRYGPWNLLCKNRHAALHVSLSHEARELSPMIEELKDDWLSYTDNLTVERSGILDGDQVMLEFSVTNKAGNLAWPREAAAKAGRVRRLAEEDTEFRNMLQGLDKEGNVMLRPPSLVGVGVDAMDSTGRWHLVQILDVKIVDEDTDEENEDFDKMRPSDMHARKKVKVDFKDHDHVDWIDVESDHLAKAGRFTNEAEQHENANENSKGGGGNSKETEHKVNKGPVTVKKSSTVESNGGENAKLCLYPGYGACGLTNLGNTCYVNSAIQCMSYMPLLRSYLLSAQYKASGDLNKDNPLGTGGRMLEEFAELLRAMWSAKYGEKMPRNFRQKLGSINSQFSAGDQQDAQEFLNYMLDVLHEDSNKVRKKPYVEALEDDWVAKTNLPRVGDEAWRRFLRRNQSIMSDVAMGQVLNTVTCPVCKYSSRNFDPFNLLSIPVPTDADVIFQCVVIRRATATNSPWTLNKPRKGDKKPTRFSRRNSRASSGPPSDSYVAEQYVIAMSRLADSSDLKSRIQKACGIPAIRLRLFRAEVAVVNEEAEEESVVRTQTKIIQFTDKEGPCSHLARKKGPNEDVAAPTLIVAFESTLRPRSLKPNNGQAEALDDTADEEDDGEPTTNDLVPTQKEEMYLKKHLEVYGDDKECRLVDTDPLVLAKAVSRSQWPRTEDDLKLGLRVDAKDKRGNWFQGSVIEIADQELDEDDVADGEPLTRREVVVHFDNFAKKWDETYTMESFDEGRVRPLYSHAVPKMKPTDFPVYHRYSDRESSKPTLFGQPFHIQCFSEWSNARAGAQILAQASRFLQHNADWSAPLDLDDPSSLERDDKAGRVYEKTQTAISDLIDILVDYDREYIKLGLGLTSHSSDSGKSQPFRNPGFDPSPVAASFAKKVNILLQRLPFEIRVAGIEATQPSNNLNAEEEIFPFTLLRTIGNFLNARQVIILHWRDHPSNDKKLGIRDPILYVPLPLEVDESGVEILKKSQKAGKERAKKARAGSSGIDLGVCLTEFCKQQNLSMDDNWRCPQCKDFREGRQHMNLWRLPDLLTFHIKRFNMSARWREKISTKVNFPLTGLDLSDWCHKQSPVMQQDSPDSHVYDLIGVVNHYGSMTGGHYVATCKATACGKDGREEVAFNFNGLGATLLESEGNDTSTGWRLGRSKAETNQGKESATMASKAAAESTEPLWLQFDDEIVDPIPPRHVVSEMAYVLFYRRRRITPSNIAKYSTLE